VKRLLSYRAAYSEGIVENTNRDNMRYSQCVGLISLMNCVGILHSIVSTAEILRERGYEVEILTNRQTVARELLPQFVSLFERTAPRWTKKFPFNLIHFLFWAHAKDRRKHYDFVIGYDPIGLVVATFLGVICRIPVIYHSLELWVSEDLPQHWKKFRWLPSEQRIIKCLERLCHKRAEFTIIQDKRRAKVLFEDNQLVPGETYYVPHTGREQIFKPSGNPSYFQEKFYIDDSKTILLMIGGINHTTLALEVVVAASEWPETWHLVIHGFSTPEYLDKVSCAIKSNNITLSTNLVSMEELSDLIASADIGLALYPNSNTNMYEMTSGKIGQYFRCGIPVIANNFPNLVDVIEGSSAGICVPHLAAVPGAVDVILEDYDCFKKKAYKAYSEFYDFDRAFEPVLKRIGEMN